MRWSNLLILASALLAALSGCRNCDLVEAELRNRNEDLRNARAELAKAEFINASLSREVTALHQQGPSKITPELAAQTTTIKEIVLTRQTGGYDQDHLPGDESLMVAFEPKDGDGHTIKAPGTAQVTAQEVSKEGLKSLLCSWDISAEELRRSWRDGLFSKGYQVILPWKNLPNTEHLRITVRFYLSDGRVFEADKDVTVRLIPPASRPAMPLPIFLDGTPGALLKPAVPLPTSGPYVPLPTSGPAVPLPMPRTSQSNKPRTEEAAWWARPAAPPPPAAPVQLEEVHWRPKYPQPSLADSVQMGKPQAIIPIAPVYQQ